MHDVDAGALRLLVDFAYAGEILISEDNVKLLNFVTLALTGIPFLLSQVADEPLLQGSGEGKDLLIEAMQYLLLPEKRNNVVSVRTTHWKPEGLRPYIFAIGGSMSATHRECEYYNPRTDRWSLSASTSHRRSRAGVAGVGRLVYAVGGFDVSNDLASVECYNPLTNQWCPVGTKRSSLGVASLDGLLYVAGGYDGASCLNSVERYDPIVTTWSSVIAMETRMGYCRMGVLDGSIYAVGGRDVEHYVSSVERLDPREGKWQQMPHMLSRRGGCGVAALDGMLYAMGWNDGSGYTRSVGRFDPLKGIWEAMASMHILS